MFPCRMSDSDGLLYFHVSHPTMLIYVHLKQTTGLQNTIAKYAAGLQFFFFCERGEGRSFCKIRHTQPVCLQFFEANHIFHLR